MKTGQESDVLTPRYRNRKLRPGLSLPHVNCTRD